MKEVTTSLIPGEIEYNGEKYLGIPTGIVGKSFSLTKISQMKQNPGWIVRGDSLSEWKITGFCKMDDGIFLYGPAIDGISLEELLSRPLEEFLPFFYTIISALVVLKTQSIPLFRISTHSVFVLSDKSVLFLPPDIFRELIDLRSFDTKRDVYTVCNHPDRTGEDNLSFSLGVFVYKVITGTFPFISETEEDIHQMMREFTVTSPKLARPGIVDKAAQFLKSSLQGTGSNHPGLENWKEVVNIWIDTGIERDISEEEIRVIKEAEEQKKKKATHTFKFKVFWYHNYVKIAAISAIILFLGSIVGFTIKNMFFRTRYTAGFSPEEVVLAYYESMNTLDYFIMDDCLLEKAGKTEATIVMNLYVMTRQRSAYEQGPTFISAKKWDARGRPPLDPYLPMYGVTQVQILSQEHNPDPVFTVSYEKWATETEDMDRDFNPGKVMYFGFYIEERLFLKQDKGDWVIYRIDVLEKRKIEEG